MKVKIPRPHELCTWRRHNGFELCRRLGEGGSDSKPTSEEEFSRALCVTALLPRPNV
nr:putative integron gene cassette protein [uncultured bacterium]CAS02991.1 putative integron gene cassette protein [uncultured bacterium]